MLLSAFSGAEARTSKAAVAGVVAQARGQVEMRGERERAWGKATVGAFVYEGDTLRCGKSGYVAVALVTGVEVKVKPETEFHVGGKAVDWFRRGGVAGMRADIGVSKGTLWARVLKRGTKFRVATPVATVGVRGTELEVEVWETGAGKEAGAAVVVFTGLVEVVNEHGTVQVGAGQGTTVTGGAAPEPPKPVDMEEKQKWLSEVKAKGGLRVTMEKVKGGVGDSLTGSVALLDAKGEADSKADGEVLITADSDNWQVSGDGGATWRTRNASAGVSGGKGRWAVRGVQGGVGSVTLTYKEYPAAVVKVEATGSPAKHVDVTVKRADGTEGVLRLKFRKPE